MKIELLRVYNRENFPVQWAMTQYNLSVAYRNQINGDRKANLEHAIQACRAALEVFTQKDFPVEWAEAQNHLGAVYCDRIEGVHQENLELAIQAYQAALEVYTPQDFPVEWARTRKNLNFACHEREVRFFHESLKLIAETPSNEERVYAFWRANIDKINRSVVQIMPDIAFQILVEEGKAVQASIAGTLALFGKLIHYFPYGNRGINIELAITCNQVCTRIFTRNEYPSFWATLQHNLGIAYLDRIEGDRKENIELAIHAYRSSLEVCTRQNFPFEWAESQNDLGNAYYNRIEGDRAANLEQAIQIYRAALEVRTRQDFPFEWAGTQNNLGAAYKDRIEGNRTANLEQAIHAYQAALEVYTRQNFPVQWAMTQYNLGAAYQIRIEGERKANLELAIHAYRAALEVRTRQNFPIEWAIIQNNLGYAYKDRIEGERKANLELAIHAYRAALEIYTRQNFPVEWAGIQTNLGYAYCDRIEGDHKVNLEHGIHAYRASLEVHTRQNFPVKWAMTQNDLGYAYYNRIEGDHKANLEHAIHACQAALEVHTRQDFPVEWAMTQNNLGNAYKDRIEGDRKANLEHAIYAYRASLEVYTRQDFPVEWARTQSNLGMTYSMQLEGERKENIEHAIRAYRSSLEVCTRRDFPVEWARIQNNLGTAYSMRIEGERKENIEHAIHAYRASLEVCTRQDFPIQWARAQHNLGAAYSVRIEGERKENIEHAIRAYRAALEVTQPELMPLNCLSTASNLGDLAFKEGDWHLAIEGFEQAITAVEKSRSWAMSDRRRQEILDESIGIYEKMLQSCINADRLNLALQTVERVRSKRLVDLMTAADLYPQGKIPEPVRLILDRITSVQQQMDDLRRVTSVNAPKLVGAQTRDRAAVAPPTAEIQALEAQKQALLDELSRYDAVSAQLVEISPPDVSHIQTELLDRPDVALLSFYMTTQDTHILVVKLHSIQCFTCSGQGVEQLQSWLIHEWVLPYINNPTSWQRNMPERLQQLADKLDLDRLVAEHLQNTRELILIPHLVLHLIPFAALPFNKNQHYFGDRFLLRYAPGCQVLKFCVDRNELPPQQQYGTVENTMEDLPFSAIEGEAIARLFEIEDTFRLRGSQQATRNAYKQLLEQVNSIASCHHAQSRLDNPLESALILANGMRVTLADLLSPAWRFADLSDVFLSCCETGMTMPQSLTDELLTLGTGFLCAGARSVISSLWAVSDIATALLSQMYHQYRAQGQDRVVALQKAQQDLRRISGNRLRAISEAEFIPTLMAQQEQLDQRRKMARRQKKQAASDSEAYRQWESEEKHYGELIDRLENTIMHLEVLWKKSLPFNHPVYWAPFTCQGLR